ncbi:hypothetical protein QR98_0069100 [Sarcoptes scabiei]|uniref:Uncharacterized protein n=1 Tax=Sarcoptes scabiei TaxID=52283 RepID=A0A132ABT8_SARSC|nr:hypothetical protein QR98_0069100 [Sarcoptes scabiei]
MHPPKTFIILEKLGFGKSHPFIPSLGNSSALLFFFGFIISKILFLLFHSLVYIPKKFITT